MARYTPPAGGAGVLDDPVGTYVASSLTFDANYVTDAVVTKNGTGLTSATAVFTTADAGKVASLTYQRYLLVSTTAASPTVTSAGLFLPEHDGMTIFISQAGTGNLLHKATLTYVDANTMTLSANAVVTRANVDALISARHHTTIFARTSATAITLTAAPTWGAAAAELAFGTDQRATLSTAAGVAMALQRNMTLPEGKALVVLSATNAYGTPLLTDDFEIRGAGLDKTEIIVVHEAELTTSIQTMLFRASKGRMKAKDMRVTHVGAPHPYSNTTLNSPTILNHSGIDPDGNNILVAQNLDIRNSGAGVLMSASTGYASRTIVEDCEIRNMASGAISHFRGSGSGDHENHVHRVFQSTSYVLKGSQTEDSSYHPHVTYIHPNVHRCYRDVDSYMAYGLTGSGVDSLIGQTPYHFRSYGGPADLPNKADHFENCRASGGGTALMTNRNSRTDERARATVINCRWDCIRALAGCIGPVTMIGGRMRTTQGYFTGLDDGNAAGAARWDFERVTFDATVLENTVTSIGVVTGHIGSTWNFTDCTPLGPAAMSSQAFRMFAFATVAHSITVRGGNFAGQAEAVFVTPAASGFSLRVLGTEFSGVWTDGIFGSTATLTDDLIDVQVDDCRFLHTSGRVMLNGAFANGNFRGRNNYFASTAILPLGSTGKSGAFQSSNRRKPTALTVSANILITDANYNEFDVTGAATVNNIRWGENQSPSLMGAGDCYFTAVTGAVTFAHLAGGTGNIRTPTSTDRIVAIGETVHFRFDSRNGIMRLVA